MFRDDAQLQSLPHSNVSGTSSNRQLLRKSREFSNINEISTIRPNKGTEEYVMFRGQWSVIRPVQDDQFLKRPGFTKNYLDPVEEVTNPLYRKYLPGIDSNSYV